jgi:hypothetical protein
MNGTTEEVAPTDDDQKDETAEEVEMEETTEKVDKDEDSEIVEGENIDKNTGLD